jgi:hypothetical protein
VSGIAARTTNANTLYNKFEGEQLSTLSPSARTEKIFSDFFNYGTNSFNEIHLHNGEFLHNIGLRGQGMRIAILDGGFFSLYNA